MRRAASVAVAALLVAASALPAAATPPLPNLDREYWFGNSQIGKVWKLGATGRGVTVAVLDSGVQADRPELRGIVLPGTNFGGGDGRVDTDVPHGHGTAMARFIAGQGGGPADLVGIAPEVRILPVTVNDAGSDALQAIPRGIGYAVSHGAKVINISLAAPGSVYPDHCPPAVASAVRAAIARGAVVVAGAGNDGNAANLPSWPAACPGVVAVGAVDGSKRAWAKSQRQSYVDVAAPGVHMTDVNLRNVLGRSDGTSNSTALVSGAVALVWSKFPRLTNRQVVARLLATVTDDATRPGRDDVTGYGIVRPYNAIADRVPADAPNPVFDELGASAREPSGAPSPSGAAPSAPDDTAGVGTSGSATPKSSSAPLVLALIGGGLVVVAVVILVLAAGRRRRPTMTPGPYAPGPYPPAS